MACAPRTVITRAAGFITDPACVEQLFAQPVHQRDASLDILIRTCLETP
jgi:hypothetical protein